MWFVFVFENDQIKVQVYEMTQIYINNLSFITVGPKNNEH